jgi:hypothetical protein
MPRDGIARMRLARGERVSSDAVDQDALFIWAALHGLASIHQTHALHTLSLSDDVLQGALDHTLYRIGIGLGVSVDRSS